MYDPEEKRERLEGLVQRYRAGEFSTDVFETSLKAIGMRRDEITDYVYANFSEHRKSLPYQRGDFR